jgi:hypothetical protein
MATKLKVTYLDDAEVEVLATPRAQVMTERFLQGFKESSLVEAGYRLAFESLLSRKLIDSGLGYEEWLDTIADVEELEEEKPDPTPEAPSPTTSSD